MGLRKKKKGGKKKWLGLAAGVAAVGAAVGIKKKRSKSSGEAVEEEAA